MESLELKVAVIEQTLTTVQKQISDIASSIGANISPPSNLGPMSPFSWSSLVQHGLLYELSMKCISLVLTFWFFGLSALCWKGQGWLPPRLVSYLPPRESFPYFLSGSFIFFNKAYYYCYDRSYSVSSLSEMFAKDKYACGLLYFSVQAILSAHYDAEHLQSLGLKSHGLGFVALLKWIHSLPVRLVRSAKSLFIDAPPPDPQPIQTAPTPSSGPSSKELGEVVARCSLHRTMRYVKAAYAVSVFSLHTSDYVFHKVSHYLAVACLVIAELLHQIGRVHEQTQTCSTYFSRKGKHLLCRAFYPIFTGFSFLALCHGAVGVKWGLMDLKWNNFWSITSETLFLCSTFS